MRRTCSALVASSVFPAPSYPRRVKRASTLCLVGNQQTIVSTVSRVSTVLSASPRHTCTHARRVTSVPQARTSPRHVQRASTIARRSPLSLPIVLHALRAHFVIVSQSATTRTIIAPLATSAQKVPIKRSHARQAHSAHLREPALRAQSHTGIAIALELPATPALPASTALMKHNQSQNFASPVLTVRLAVCIRLPVTLATTASLAQQPRQSAHQASTVVVAKRSCTSANSEPTVLKEALSR